MSDAFMATTEMRYDLLRDHQDVILSLLDRPMTEPEAVSALGSVTVLDRLVRHGLITRHGADVRATSNTYHQVRQEGMMSFLSRYVTADLTAAIDHPKNASLWTAFLALEPLAITALRAGPVHTLFETLRDISDQPAQGPTTKLTVLVLGTSRLIDEDLPDDEAALRHLQQACAQRATASERDQAVVSELSFLADASRFEAAQIALANVTQQWATISRPSSQGATYHLTIASHWIAEKA